MSQPVAVVARRQGTFSFSFVTVSFSFVTLPRIAGPPLVGVATRFQPGFEGEEGKTHRRERRVKTHQGERRRRSRPARNSEPRSSQSQEQGNWRERRGRYKGSVTHA